jgi:rhodanese-related sulfurtransferase/mannose-6-phosphate isomerase-like protein (cupin superfamily)
MRFTVASNTRLARETGTTPEASTIVDEASSRSPRELADIVERFASRLDEWIGRVRLRVDCRWYERLYQGPDYDVWVISWLPGQATGLHDHGASSGAFVVATGLLEEQRPGERARVVRPGTSRAFGRGYTHDVRNASFAPAISIHAYSPPLTEMNEYELDGVRLIPRDRADPQAEAVDQDWRTRAGSPADRPGVQCVEQVLEAARARLRRLPPEDVYEAVSTDSAVLVDIRPAAQRAREGSIEGALVVERNVLEWRFDPASSSRLPVATGHDVQVIVFCSEGYTSSLAAAALQDLGLWRATDMAGGFQAWRAMGLPSVRPAEETNE